jgi:hypothetical protein
VDFYGSCLENGILAKKIKCLVIVYMSQTISVGSITETKTSGNTTAMTIGVS